MKHYRVRTETAVMGSNLLCVACGQLNADLAIVPIGLPIVAGVHKRCVDKLHRKRGEEPEPIIVETTPKEAPPPSTPETSKASFFADQDRRAALVERGIKEKLIPSGMPLDEAWTRLTYSAPKGWFKQEMQEQPKPPVSPPPAAKTVGEMPGENIGELGRLLKERGVDISLIDLAAWGVMKRDVARAWLEQGGDRPEWFPSACAACDNGVPDDVANGYKHTGEGPACRKLKRCKGPGGSHRFDTRPDAEGRRHCHDCDQLINVTTGFCPKCGVEVGVGNDALCKDCAPKTVEGKTATTVPVEIPASWIETGRVCAREGCGKTVTERNSSRVGDELYCSAKCALPKGLGQVEGKPSAAERTVPLPLEPKEVDAKPNLEW